MAIVTRWPLSNAFMARLMSSPLAVRNIQSDTSQSLSEPCEVSGVSAVRCFPRSLTGFLCRWYRGVSDVFMT
jgi:hypothetical protein